MSLSTNGWDYIYNINLTKLNTNRALDIDSSLNTEENENYNLSNFINTLNNSIESKTNPISDIETLNAFIKRQLIRYLDKNLILVEYGKNIEENIIVNIIKNIEGYIFDDIKFDDTTFTTTSNLIDYLLNCLSIIIDKLHDKNHYTTLNLIYKNLTKKITLDDKTEEKEILKNRAKIYLESSDEIKHIYDLDTNISTHNNFTHKDIKSLMDTNFVSIKNILVTLFSALYPVNQNNNAAIFYNAPDFNGENYRLNITNIKNWKFTTGDDEGYVYIDYILNLTQHLAKDISSETNLGDCKVSIKLNLSWLVGKDSFKTDYAANTSSIEIISIDDLTAEFPDTHQFVKSSLESYFNNKHPDFTYHIGENFYASTPNFHRYYHAFLNLCMPAIQALQKEDLLWMYPTTIIYGIKNAYSNVSTNSSVLSMCCMVEENTNYNEPYVDLNAIPTNSTSDVDINAVPKNATTDLDLKAISESSTSNVVLKKILEYSSALVIERSVFGKKMIVDKIGKKVLDIDEGGIKSQSVFSFSNSEDELKLEGNSNFNNGNLLGIIPYFEILTRYIDIFNSQTPKIDKNNVIISFREDTINLLLKDIKYQFSLENYPKVTVEYDISVKYENNNKITPKIEVKNSSMNYFHTDFMLEAFQLGVNIYSKYQENKSSDIKTKHSILPYLPLDKRTIEQINIGVLEDLTADVSQTLEDISSKLKDYQAKQSEEKQSEEKILDENFNEFNKEITKLKYYFDNNTTEVTKDFLYDTKFKDFLRDLLKSFVNFKTEFLFLKNELSKTDNTIEEGKVEQNIQFIEVIKKLTEKSIELINSHNILEKDFIEFKKRNENNRLTTNLNDYFKEVLSRSVEKKINYECIKKTFRKITYCCKRKSNKVRSEPQSDIAQGSEMTRTENTSLDTTISPINNTLSQIKVPSYEILDFNEILALMIKNKPGFKKYQFNEVVNSDSFKFLVKSFSFNYHGEGKKKKKEPKIKIYKGEIEFKAWEIKNNDIEKDETVKFELIIEKSKKEIKAKSLIYFIDTEEPIKEIKDSLLTIIYGCISYIYSNDTMEKKSKLQILRSAISIDTLTPIASTLNQEAIQNSFNPEADDEGSFKKNIKEALTSIELPTLHSDEILDIQLNDSFVISYGKIIIEEIK